MALSLVPVLVAGGLAALFAGCASPDVTAEAPGSAPPAVAEAPRPVSRFAFEPITRTLVVRDGRATVPVRIVRSEGAEAIRVTVEDDRIRAADLLLDAGTNEGALAIEVLLDRRPRPTQLRLLATTASGSTARAEVPLLVRGRAGSIDERFGTGGQTSVPFPRAGLGGFGIAVGPDDRITVAAGCSVSGAFRTCALRLGPDGVLDPSYGGESAAIPLGIPRAFAVQSNGALLVLGDHGELGRITPAGAWDTRFGIKALGAGLPGPLIDSYEIAKCEDDSFYVVFAVARTVAVRRYTREGDLVTTWAANGVNLHAWSSAQTSAGSLCTREGDYLGVATWTDDASSASGVGLVRTSRATGALDATFGTRGVGSIADPEPRGLRGALLPRANGGVFAIFGSRTTEGLVVAAFPPDGKTFDATFGDNGRVRLADRSFGGAVLGEGGTLVVATQSRDRSEIVRLLPDGRVDPSFGTAGAAVLPGAGSLAGQSDERLLFVTTAPTGLVISRLWN